jgi:uncharacterized protein YjbI with pentapeptide repeats
MKEKLEIINKLYNTSETVSLLALDELRQCGWLTDGTLKGYTLCNLYLRGANLKNACLTNVDFHQSHLEWADFSFVNLQNAKLTRANFSGANFDQADLKNADLYKTNFRNARNLTPEQLQQAKRLWGAIMPDSETYDGRYNLPADIELARWNNINLQDPQAMADFYGVSLQRYLEHQPAEVLIPAL